VGGRSASRSKPAALPDAEAEELFSLLAGASPATAALRLTPKRRGSLEARVSEHGANAVRLVASWVAAGQHPRARFLRDEHGDVNTLLRPEKFAEYLEFAQAWRNGVRPPTPAARGSPGGSSDRLAVLAQLAFQEPP